MSNESVPTPAASRPKHKKLARLPSNAKIQKRPLLRPAIPSPYAGASQQKVIYVSAKTPFLSAVKRVEKLLHLADKRLVQGATASAQKNQIYAGNKRKRGGNSGGDEILGVAREVERVKGEREKRRKVGDGAGDYDEGREDVVMKGTGKAIHRVLELALWFQQREEEYVVRLRTGSVSAIDDIAVEEGAAAEGAAAENGGGDAEGGAEEGEGEAMDVDGVEEMESARGQIESDPKPDHERQAVNTESGSRMTKKKTQRKQQDALAANDVPESRIRYTSVLEAAVSLR